MREKFGKKRMTYLGMIVALFVTIGISYTSYAIFIKQDKVKNIDLLAGQLNYTLTGEGLEENQVTLIGKESKIIEVTITAANEIDSKYEMYYNTTNNNVNISYISTKGDPAAGEITKTGEKTVAVKLTNNVSNNVIITLGVQGGFTNKTLTLTKGNRLTEIQSITASELEYANSSTSCTTVQCAVDELRDIFK